MEIDLATLEGAAAIPTEFVVERTAVFDTIVDGACVWFEAVFDDETVLTTSPLAPVTSWGNRLFRLDREVGQGEQLRLRVRMSELDEPATWSVTEARA